MSLDRAGRGTVAALFAAVALFAFVLYARSVRNEFVWDDPIVMGQQLQAFHSVGEAFFPPPRIPQFGRLYYRPIITLTYVIDRQLDQALWRDSKFAFHFPVVLFHALNTGLLFLIGRRLLARVDGGTLAALGAALLFAAHPIHTESVCWMAGRSDTLMALFLLPALLAYLAWGHGRGHRIWLVLAAVLFLGGCLVKETAVGFLALVVGIDLLSLRGKGSISFLHPDGGSDEATRAGTPAKTRSEGAKRDGGRKVGEGSGSKGRARAGRDGAVRQGPSFSTVVAGWALFAGAFALYYALRLKGLAAERETLHSQEHDFFATLGNVTRAVGFYLRKIAWPTNLDAYIPSVPYPGAMFILGLVGSVGLAALGAWLWTKGDRRPVFFGIWFFGTLAPSLAIAIFAISEAPVAERYLYLPSAGFCLLLAYLALVKVPSLAPEPLRRGALVAGGVAILTVTGIYAVATMQRGAVWRSDLEFWKDGVAKSPGEGLPHLHLGLAYANLDKDKEAEAEYMQAIDPNVEYDAEGRSIALNNLGMLYLGRHRYDEADGFFRRALELRSDYPTPMYGLGLTGIRRAEQALAGGDQEAADRLSRDAERSLRRAIDLNPQYMKAHNQLAFLLINTGRAAEAEGHVDRVLQLVSSGQERDLALRLKATIAQEKAPAGGARP